MTRASMSVLLALAFAMLIFLPMCQSADSEAVSDSAEGRIMNVMNVYGCEFDSLGTIPSYEDETYYFFVKGSDNYGAFLSFTEGNLGVWSGDDDFPVIAEGDRVCAFFFSSETYTDGYEAILEFYNYSGTLYKGYLQLTFTVFVGIDTVQHFFMKGTTAVIRWSSSPPVLLVYLGDRNISKNAVFDTEKGCFEVEVDIDRNGVYPLYFVNNSNSTIVATVNYSIDGFESSWSLSLATLGAVLAAVTALVLVACHEGPRWSGKGGLRSRGGAE